MIHIWQRDDFGQTCEWLTRQIKAFECKLVELAY